MKWYQHDYNTPTALKVVFTIIPRVPKFLHPAIAAVTALIFFCLLKKERKAVMKNLYHINKSGYLRRLWLTLRVFYSFCDFVVSYCFVPKAEHSELLKMLTMDDRGADKIDKCLAAGNGLIALTAHMGNWEFGSRLLELHDCPVNVARVVETDKPAELALRDLMSNERLRIVQLNDDVFASVKLLHALRQNEIVAIQADRVYQRFNGKACFFGKDVEFPLGPFFLAYISGAPIMPGIIIRDKWLRYRVITGEVITLDSNRERDSELLKSLQQVVAFLESNIRRYPSQWLNFYDFWGADDPPAQQTNSYSIDKAEAEDIGQD